MPTQQTTLLAGSSAVTAKDGTPLNPLAVNLAKAIRQQESGGDYNAVGDLDRGVSKGAYQFNRDNFQNWAKESGFDPNDFSPVNQDKVAYTRINKLLQEGKSPSEVAALWNGAKTVNGKIQAINPQYVESVKQHYAQVVGSQPQGSQPSQIAGTNVAQAAGPEVQQPQDNRNILQKGLDFAFPIVSDLANVVQGKNEKTPGQIIGDTALSALWFVPGLGVGAGIGSKLATGAVGKLLGETGTRLAGEAITGATTGYGADVASKLSEGKGLGEAVKPGAGTALGAIGGPLLGAAGRKVGGLFTEAGQLGKLQKNIEETLVANKPGRRLINAAKAEGHNPAELIAKSGAVPDVVDGKFSTTEAQDVLQKRIAGLGEARAEALDTMGTVVKLKDLETEALKAAKDPYILASGQSVKIQRQIKNLFADFKKNYGNSISVKDLEKIKEAQAQASRIYKRTGQIGEDNASSLIGTVARRKVEDIAEKSGFSGMKEYNKYIQSHYRAVDVLEKIEGQPVKGGRLGNMLRGHALGIAAGIGGGGIPGFLAGEAANKVLSKILGDTQLSNPLRDAILKRMTQANPAIVDELLKFSEQQGKQVAPLLTPKGGKSAGAVPRLINQAVTRGVLNTTGSQ